MKQGTESVEFGKGSLLTELWSAVILHGPVIYAPAFQRAKRRIGRISDFYSQMGLAQIDRSGRPELAIVKTNVKLTGEPLTAEDVQRIAECK